MSIEAYSQTAWRPVKPLVRAHLRKAVNKPHCSGLPDRTTLRQHDVALAEISLEDIVPVFQTGLYIEAETLERRGGEVLPGEIGPDVLCG